MAAKTVLINDKRDLIITMECFKDIFSWNFLIYNKKKLTCILIVKLLETKTELPLKIHQKVNNVVKLLSGPLLCFNKTITFCIKKAEYFLFYD